MEQPGSRLAALDSNTEIGKRRAKFEAAASKTNQLEKKSSFLKPKGSLRAPSGPRKSRRITNLQSSPSYSLHSIPSGPPLSKTTKASPELISENESLRTELQKAKKEVSELRKEVQNLKDSSAESTAALGKRSPPTTSEDDDGASRKHAIQARDVLASSLSIVQDDQGGKENMGALAVRCLEDYLKSKREDLLEFSQK